MSDRVRDWMGRDVRTIREDVSLPALDRQLIEARVSGFPVVTDAGRLVGVVSRSDVVRQMSVEQTWAETLSGYYTDGGLYEEGEPSLAEVGARLGHRLEERTVAEVMSRDPVTIGPDEPLSEAARVLVERRIHRLPVVEKGRLVGILTSLDLAAFVAKHG